MNASEIHERIFSKSREQNRKVVQEVLKRNPECLWIVCRSLYETLPKSSFQAKRLHRQIGAYRACRKCYLCLSRNMEIGEKPSTDEIFCKQMPRKQKPNKHTRIGHQYAKQLWDPYNGDIR